VALKLGAKVVALVGLALLEEARVAGGLLNFRRLSLPPLQGHAQAVWVSVLRLKEVARLFLLGRGIAAVPILFVVSACFFIILFHYIHQTLFLVEILSRLNAVSPEHI